MNSGNESSRCYRNPSAAGVAAHPKTTDKSLKASSGSSKPVPGGATCPKTSVSVPASAGSGCAGGTNKASGCACGAPFFGNWTSVANSTGRKRFGREFCSCQKGGDAVGKTKRG